MCPEFPFMSSHMYHYFHFMRTGFLQHYYKRSNVESTFSMIKRKFGDSLRSKTDAATANETLCKILCHSLVVLIQETRELGIEPKLKDATRISRWPLGQHRLRVVCKLARPCNCC